MKYKLLKDLPFLKANSILSYGTWVGGGLGVDLGETKYGSHNGVKTFDDCQNELLTTIFENEEWIALLPNTIKEALYLYDTKYFNQEKFLNYLRTNKEKTL